METIERDYAPKGVRFYYVYKALAHPEYDNYVTPYTLDERLMHIAEAKRTLGSRITWLADSMSNDLKRALGGVPNGELVIDPQGKVARRRAWSNPTALRRDLEELVGAVENPTQVSDLDLVTAPPKPMVASGIVPRLEVPGPMRAVKLVPHTDGMKTPFYTKLRAEAEPDLLRKGKGKLYLGFHLDPLHEVHWNNLSPPLEFEVEAPKGVRVSPVKAKAPKVKEPADSDPREFLVDVKAKGHQRSFDLAVRYYACDNANTFCVPVTQNYTVHLERDPDGGTVFGRSGRSAGGGARGGGPAGSDLVTFMKGLDANGDGRLVFDELPAPMQQRFDQMDTNGDGAVDDDEMEAVAKRLRRRGPG